MIQEPLRPHRAIVDHLGNICLPDASVKPLAQQDQIFSKNVETSIFEDDTQCTFNECVCDTIIDPWLSTDFGEVSNDPRPVIRERITSVLNDFIDEGTRQFEVSAQESRDLSRLAAQASENILRSAWNFLTQPVWIPGRNRQPKQYGRGTLFLLDTVRFGGTFALLFCVLFSVLNYESFWAIAQSYVDPMIAMTDQEAIVSLDHPNASQPSSMIGSLPMALGSYGILRVLPPVGPPDNRIVIPTLNLNVPIIIPSRDALIAEDWKQLEENIQMGLQNGVVHYPGTADPGQPGNFFITGHSSYFPWAPGIYKSVFARLHELNVGDEYFVYYGGDRFRYIIEEKKEIYPSDVSVLDQPVDKRISTLMTCTPVGTTLRRLIIVAQEVDQISSKPLGVGEHQNASTTTKLRMDMLPI